MADFQAHLSKLEERDIEVIVASADSCAIAMKTITRQGLTYPVACELDVKKIAALTGAYIQDKAEYLQATSFILDPNGKVAEAIYSTGSVGRLWATEALDMINYHLKKRWQEGRVSAVSDGDSTL